jgi:hypothetical protein
LGAIGAGVAGSGKPSAPRPTPSEKPEAAEASGDGSFFPKTDSKEDMPPAEDRTVMKQAAELLEDALREAGGSMDEIDDKKPEDRKDDRAGAARDEAAAKPTGDKTDEKTEAKGKAVDKPAKRD